MELGTISILVQLLLIFVLVAVFAGLRRLRIRRERRTLPGAAPAPAPASSPPWPMVRAMSAAVPPAAPVLSELPTPTWHAPVVAPNLVSEELLPGCFADTCADWAQIPPASAKAPDTRFSLADWSAPTDHVALDTTVDPASLDWALEAQVDLPRAPYPAAVRGASRAGGAPMSCTIAPQERQCA